MDERTAAAANEPGTAAAIPGTAAGPSATIPAPGKLIDAKTSPKDPAHITYMR